MKDVLAYSAIFKNADVRQRHVDAITPEVEEIRRALDALGDLDSEAEMLREAVREACAAALQGSYGIGAVLVHPEHGIVARGHNQISAPNEPMRHVLHAEMDTLRAFHCAEDVVRLLRPVECVMFSTLEPCPMCTIGMWNEGVRRVRVGAADAATGWLISNGEFVPPGWRELLDRSQTEHRLAAVDPALRGLCDQIFALTRRRLDALLTSNARD